MTHNGARIKVATPQSFSGARHTIKRGSREKLDRANAAAKAIRRKYPVPIGGDHPVAPRMRQSVEIHKNTGVIYAK